MPGNRITVFTKPWKMGLPELASFVRGLGFDGIELPVRPGYPVTPENVERGLPEAARILAEHGLTIESIAGPTDERTIAACADAGVRIIRICVSFPREQPYREGERELRSRLEGLMPALERCGVTLGIQNHYGPNSVCNAGGLRSLLDGLPRAMVAAVWDAGHSGLEGEQPEMALDLVWPHLCMVNLKSAFWRRVNGPEEAQAAWEPYWTTGRHGRAEWPRVAAELKRRSFAGPICLTAEYTCEEAVDRLIVEDLALARSLFG